METAGVAGRLQKTVAVEIVEVHEAVAFVALGYRAPERAPWGLLVRMLNMGGMENAACFSYPQVEENTRILGGSLRVGDEGRATPLNIDLLPSDADDVFAPRETGLAESGAEGKVVNVNDLQHALELFQKDPQIVQIQAYLEPTSMRGVSALRVVVKEAPFYDVSGDFDNHRSPSIGSSGGSISVGTHNLIGFGDDWTSRFSGSEGLSQIEAGFSIPVSLWDTRFKARYQYSEGEVVDDDFKALDIESESEEVGFALTQPLYRGERLDVRATIRADWRRAQSFLFGGAIGLPTAYDDEGKSKVSVLRLGFDASYRSQNQSVVLRSLVSRDFDVLGATSNPGSGQASGEFWAWLGQIQWASRLPWWNAQLLTRFETQLASDPLLPLEQFAIGGRYTVRGYRENTLVQDNGLVGSIELRLPVYRQFSPEILFELVPFIDVGRSWNELRSTALASDQRQTIASVGIGGRWTVSRWGFAELYWGHQLNKVDLLNDSDLQDDGVSFRVGLSWP